MYHLRLLFMYVARMPNNLTTVRQVLDNNMI